MNPRTYMTAYRGYQCAIEMRIPLGTQFRAGGYRMTSNKPSVDEAYVVGTRSNPLGTFLVFLSQDHSQVIVNFTVVPGSSQGW